MIRNTRIFWSHQLLWFKMLSSHFGNKWFPKKVISGNSTSKFFSDHLQTWIMTVDVFSISRQIAFSDIFFWTVYPKFWQNLTVMKNDDRINISPGWIQKRIVSDMSRMMNSDQFKKISKCQKKIHLTFFLSKRR